MFFFSLFLMQLEEDLMFGVDDVLGQVGLGYCFLVVVKVVDWCWCCIEFGDCGVEVYQELCEYVVFMVEGDVGLFEWVVDVQLLLLLYFVLFLVVVEVCDLRC